MGNAQELDLPAPGRMVHLTTAFEPVLLKGLKVHPDNPLMFDFIMDTGNSRFKFEEGIFKDECNRPIKYFLSALTVPEKNLWVNLSPYEKDHMIADDLGHTQMGQDMLAQDYILKQLTASLIYPKDGLGKEFWDNVYKEAWGKYGKSDMPVNAFNKVWIVAQQADVYEGKDSVFVTGAHLKVMMEQDYVATQHNRSGERSSKGVVEPTNQTTSNMIRQIILPAIEKEVNEGRNFAPLRQMYYSMILASWYKMRLKDALITQVYGNKSKVAAGVNAEDPNKKEIIFNHYLQAYKKGVFNFIKEEKDLISQQMIPRKYFSGGLQVDAAHVMHIDHAMPSSGSVRGELVMVKGIVDPAMTSLVTKNKPEILVVSIGETKSDSAKELKSTGYVIHNVQARYYFQTKSLLTNILSIVLRSKIDLLVVEVEEQVRTREKGAEIDRLIKDLFQAIEMVQPLKALKILIRGRVLKERDHFQFLDLHPLLPQEDIKTKVEGLLFPFNHKYPVRKKIRVPRHDQSDQVKLLSGKGVGSVGVMVVSRYNATFQDRMIHLLLKDHQVWRAPSTQSAKDFLYIHPEVGLVVAFGFKKEISSSFSEGGKRKVLGVQVDTFGDIKDLVGEVDHELADFAMKSTGGIDLDARKLSMNIAENGQRITMHINPSMLSRFKQGDFSGLVFKIAQIIPIVDLQEVLGR